MSTFVFDTFIGTSGLWLRDHIGETGASWSSAYVESTASHARIGSGNRATTYWDGVTSSQHLYYVASGAPASMNYAVTADIQLGNLKLDGSPEAGLMGISGRVTENPGNLPDHVSLYWVRDGWYVIYNTLAGGQNTLGAWSDPFVSAGVGATRNAQLRMVGDTIEGYIDNILRITGTLPVVLATGKAGIFARVSPAGYEHYLDNFQAYDIATPDATRRRVFVSYL